MSKLSTTSHFHHGVKTWHTHCQTIDLDYSMSSHSYDTTLKFRTADRSNKNKQIFNVLLLNLTSNQQHYQSYDGVKTW
jgi:hypothetical protein